MGRFTFADAKEKIKDLEVEVSTLKKDLTDKDGLVSKKTHIITLILAFIGGFVLAGLI